VISSLLIDTLTTYVPFRLLRPLSPAHSASPAVANRELVTDFSIQASTTFLAASIYSVVLYASYVTFLPVSLATYFSGIPSVAAVHSATPITLLPLTLPIGLAAKTFIFTPAAAASSEAAAAFDPVTASLTETLWYNLWGYSARSKVFVQRTLVLVLLCFTHTFIQTLVTIRDVEAPGALAYAGVWAVAAGTTGTVLGLVGAV
jgi:hypothetical protein